MAKPQLTVHMVVKNEDIFIWYAIMSIINFAERILIFDTGSKDNTVKVIKSIKSSKIEFSPKGPVDSQGLVALRKKQIDKTKTDWIWVVDGDEIYPRKTAEEIVKGISQNRYIGAVVKRYDLLGDIYHYQSETVGAYNLYGRKGHLVLRLINKSKINGLHLEGNYPLEGYYDGKGKALIDYDPKKLFFTQNRLFHSMYLRRSTSGSTLSDTLHRHKYKIETGNYFSATENFPNVFFLDHPPIVPDVTQIRDSRFEITARFITPVKKLKRKIWSLNS